MYNPPKLIDEQLRAASAAEKRLYIEASPGSGKTSVAAERFGLLHFGAPADGRATLDRYLALGRPR